MAKLNAVEFAKLWGDVSKLDTKLLVRLQGLLQDEIVKRLQASAKGARIDDRVETATPVASA